MDRQIIFKNKLEELTALAAACGGKLTKTQVDEVIGTLLTKEQVDLVCQYLEQMKIKVEGWSQTLEERLEGRRKLGLGSAEESAAAAGQSEDIEGADAEGADTSIEEADTSALEVYLEELEQMIERDSLEVLTLLKGAISGDKASLEKAAQFYLPMVCDLAGEYEKDAAMPVEDLIQEGNMALWMALTQMEEAESVAQVEAQLVNAVNKRMEEAIKEELDETDSDQALAHKVDSLHGAIKKLQEELGHAVSLEELSAFLEMPAEELEDVLNLAGDQLKTKEE